MRTEFSLQDTDALIAEIRRTTKLDDAATVFLDGGRFHVFPGVDSFTMKKWIMDRGEHPPMFVGQYRRDSRAETIRYDVEDALQESGELSVEPWRPGWLLVGMAITVGLGACTAITLGGGVFYAITEWFKAWWVS